MTTTKPTSLVPAAGLAVTVLGSGGPFTTRDRVSSGYLIWLDGRPRLLVDAAGGVLQRVGQAGIDLSQLDAVLLTHLHIDHSGGLAPIAFSAYLNERQLRRELVADLLEQRGKHHGIHSRANAAMIASASPGYAESSAHLPREPR